MIIKNLRYTRENLGLKQKDLTTLFNVTYSTISGWETGKDTIPLRQLIKYANKYNFSFPSFSIGPIINIYQSLLV